MRRLLSLAIGLIGLLPGLALAVPPIQHWTLDNGAGVYFVATDALPIVDVRITFDAGGARDGKLPGLARLTMGLIDQGNGGLDAGEIARRFETVGARLSGGSERDMAWLHLRSLADPAALKPAVDTLALVLGKPDFPEAALARQRAQMLVGLQAVKQSPDQLGERAFYAAIYGDHPYAAPPSGTEESVQAIERPQVLEFYKRYYTAGNATVAIVGQLTRAQAEAIAIQITADLPAGKAAPALPPVPQGKVLGQVHVPFESSQTHILMGQPAIDRRSPDLYAFMVGNHILGGAGLVSVLSHAMREERGLSYSSSSHFVASARPGPFILATQVRNDSTGEAIQVFREVMTQLLEKGPTEAQLKAAKLNITGSFPLNLDSNSDIVGYLSVIGFYDLPLDYLDTYVERITQVSAADVRRAFSQHLSLDAMATVLVGPAQAAADAKR